MYVRSQSVSLLFRTLHTDFYYFRIRKRHPMLYKEIHSLHFQLTYLEVLMKISTNLAYTTQLLLPN